MTCNAQFRSPATGAVKLLALGALCLASAACASSSKIKTAGDLNGEAMYKRLAWAEARPVNITGRLDALQSAVSAANTMSNTVFAAKYAQYESFNQRAFLNAQYARAQTAARRQYEAELERLRLEAARSSGSRPYVVQSMNGVKIAPASTGGISGYQLGSMAVSQAQSTFNWGRYGGPRP